jgi:dTMP kinase
MTNSGKFITFEGIDGAGKSTQIDRLSAHLRAAGKQIVVTREPGGTPVGEALRSVVLHQAMGVETEALVMFAARKEHVDTVIAPALSRGDWVLCDRFTDATLAYQGGGRGVPMARLRALADWCHRGIWPDCTFLFDLPPHVAAQRRGVRQQNDVAPAATGDRFEQEQVAFFERVRTAYLQLAATEPGRFHMVDAQKDPESIWKLLEKYVSNI